MKDKGHSHLFQKEMYLDFCYIYYTLDYIRYKTNGKVTIGWGQFSKRAKPICLTNSGNDCLTTILKVFSKTISGTTLGRSLCFSQGCDNAL